MSQDQLVAAYLDGHISRRALIRRLIAGGISLGAAISYAHLLRPEAAGARILRGLHGATLSAEMVVQHLDRVIRNRHVKVRLTSSGPHVWQLHLHLYRSPEKTGYPDAVIGSLAAEFTEAGTRTFKVPFGDEPVRSPYAVEAMKRQKRKARLGISLFDGDDPSPLAVANFKR